MDNVLFGTIRNFERSIALSGPLSMASEKFLKRCCTTLDDGIRVGDVEWWSLYIIFYSPYEHRQSFTLLDKNCIFDLEPFCAK